MKSRDCLTVSVNEAAALLGVSRSSAYEYVRSGQLPAVRLGRRLLVPLAAIHSIACGATSIDPDLEQSQASLKRSDLPQST